MNAKLISFSGGRSSAMMTKIMLDNGLIDDNTIIAFANTGKEREETLQFVQDCATHWNLEIVWVEYIPEKPLFKIVDFETAAREGEPFTFLIEKRGRYLPNAIQRICTGDLKIKTLYRLMRSLGAKSGYIEYMGIRADEPMRYHKIKDRANMPLYEMGITKRHVKEFWDKQPFDLNIPDGWGNCDLCFQKGRSYTGKLVKLIREEPSRADWWINQGENTGAQFIKDISYKTLKHIALNQTTLNFDLLEEVEDTVDCYCGG